VYRGRRRNVLETNGEITQPNEHGQASPDEPVKRGRGRPKGLGKVPGSGRRKANGVPNDAARESASAPDAPEKNVGGRPSIYSEPIAAEILARRAEGETLTSICNDPRMPCASLVRRWRQDNHENFGDRFKSANLLCLEAWGDQILDISDDRMGDFVGTNERTGLPIWDNENVQRSRLRADNRKWLLERLLPAVYGQRVAVTGAADAPPIQTEDVSDRSLARTVLSILTSAQLKDGETVEGSALGQFAAAAIGTPRGLFGAPAGVAEAEIVPDGAGIDDEIDLADFAAGDLATVGDLNIEFIAGDTHANARFWILDREGRRLAPITGTEAAKAASRAYAATGQISRGARPQEAAPSAPLKKASTPRSQEILDLAALPEQQPFPPRQPRVVRSR
jgi:hypothetical protein